jgi:hypothetical protein
MVYNTKKFTGLLIVAKAKTRYTSRTEVEYHDDMKWEYEWRGARFLIKEKKIIHPNEKSLIEALKEFARCHLVD